MSNEIQKREDKVSVEYVPYGNQDKIKLSVAIVQNLIAVKTKSGKTCSEKDAIKFLAMCQAKRLNPFEGDAFLIGYDNSDGTASFSLITAHQTYLKRAELHPEFDGMKSGIIVRDGDTLRDLEGDFYDNAQVVVGGWATVFFKNRKQPMHKRLRVERFRKPFGIWKDDSAGMICKCAEADALRSAFPTMLGGLYMREEVELQPTKPEFTRPIFDVPAKLENGKAPEPETQAAPEPEPTQEAPPSNGFNAVKALYNLCENGKIKPTMLLGFLAETGSIEPGMQDFEELALKAPGVLKLAVDQFADIKRRIDEVTKGVQP